MHGRNFYHWMDAHLLMYILIEGTVEFKHLKKTCDIDINHGPLKHDLSKICSY